MDEFDGTIRLKQEPVKLQREAVYCNAKLYWWTGRSYSGLGGDNNPFGLLLKGTASSTNLPQSDPYRFIANHEPMPLEYDLLCSFGDRKAHL